MNFRMSKVQRNGQIHWWLEIDIWKRVVRFPPLLPGSFIFFFLWPHLWHMKVPGPGVKLELQLLAYAIATATRDPSHICDLYRSFRQCQILNPLLSKAQDWTHIPWQLFISVEWFHKASLPSKWQDSGKNSGVHFDKASATVGVSRPLPIPPLVPLVYQMVPGTLKPLSWKWVILYAQPFYMLATLLSWFVAHWHY